MVRVHLNLNLNLNPNLGLWLISTRDLSRIPLCRCKRNRTRGYLSAQSHLCGAPKLRTNPPRFDLIRDPLCHGTCTFGGVFNIYRSILLCLDFLFSLTYSLAFSFGRLSGIWILNFEFFLFI